MTHLPRVTRQFIDGPFGQVHLRQAGEESASGLPVVCLHMSPKSGKGYAEVLPFLARDRLALAPDNPGHGESDPPPAQPEVTIADYADSAWAAIDAMTKRKVHLIGYHTGSMVAVEAAIQRPDQVASIINISAPVFTPEELDSLNQEFAPIPLDEAGNRFRIMWERVMEFRGPDMTLEMAAASFAENLRGGEDYEWGHRAAFAYGMKYRARLGQIVQPLLVVNPKDDCWEVSQRADALWNHGRRVDRPEWGHGFLNATPDDAAALFLDFIRQFED